MWKLFAYGIIFAHWKSNIGMLCLQELFFGGGWFSWNFVNDVYIVIKGKKIINMEKNKNVELTHCRLQSGYKMLTENLGIFLSGMW